MVTVEVTQVVTETFKIPEIVTKYKSHNLCRFIHNSDASFECKGVACQECIFNFIKTKIDEG